MLSSTRRTYLTLPSIVTLAFFLFGHAAAQNTIHVPSDQATIQAAINAANTGDTVLVAPGTYSENLNFNGKLITVTSSGGASVTTIDGGAKAPVVIFNSGEGPNSVLNGFTLQNGRADGTISNQNFDGGGVSIHSTSPTITNNIIQHNTACASGGGIAVEFSSSRIEGNTVQNNTQSGCSGGYGGGIAIGGAGQAQIIGNVIVNNTWPSGDGGGISMNAAGTPTIRNNIITGNAATGVSPASQGGGISMINDSAALIVQNLIYNNSAGQGGGIYFGVPSGDRGPVLVNNTIVGNFGGSQGSAVYAQGFDNQVQFFNNILSGPSGQNAVYCDATYIPQPPTFTNNDAYSPNGTGLAGTCASQSGQNGNISVDPQFVNVATGDFHLQTTSPAIDAGTNAAPSLPQTDFAGNPRILDGNNDCVSTIDLGPYELVRAANASFSTNALSFPNQAIGTSSSAQPVTLTNTGATCFQFSSIGITGDFSQANSCSAAGVRGGASCAFNVTFTPAATGTRLGTLAVTGSDGITTRTPSVSLSGVGVDFSIAATPGTATVKHGQSAKFSITINPVGGAFNSAVALSCSGLASAATCNFSPSSAIPGSSGTTAALTLSTSGKTPRGTFIVQIIGNSGGGQHTVTVRVTVN